MPTLDERDLDPDPFGQFTAWYAEAVAAGQIEPAAMTVATATPEGRPSARVVLLRGFDERGFVFHTNYESAKGRELAVNPWAALVVHWDLLGRQVRISGRVERLSREGSEAYFASRPAGSRRAAWASAQSDVVFGGRAELEQAFAKAEARFPDDLVPLPPFWGGYRVVPDEIEFWQSQPNRLHDRLRYRRIDEVSWVVERLAP